MRERVQSVSTCETVCALVKTELSDDVAWYVGLDGLSSVTLNRLQQTIELRRVKFLHISRSLNDLFQSWPCPVRT